MKSYRLFMLALIFACLCNLAATDDRENGASKDVRAAIENSNVLYFDAFRKGQPALFIDRYANDACILPPNTQALCGENAAATFFATAYDQMGIRDGKFTIYEIYGKGDGYVTEYGAFALWDATGELVDNGKYLVLWKNTHEGWKMFRDCFSSDNPVK